MAQPIKNELIAVLEQIERDKGLRKEDVLHMIEQSLVSAYRKHVGQMYEVEAVIDPETGQIRANVIKTAVEAVQNPVLEISMVEAKKIQSGVEAGQPVKIPVDTDEFSRIAAQAAKQVLIQKIRESERASLFEEYKPKEGTLVSGAVHRFSSGNIVVDMGRAEGIIPMREQVRREKWMVGDHVRVLLLKVEKGPRGPEVILSRTHPDFVKRLFEQEVPEIYEKIVEVVNVVREPGFRSKVVVKSNNPKVDPIGSCVGVKGSRVRPIINELQGERIDLVAYNDDPASYIASALAPVKPMSVTIVSHEHRKAEVLISDDQMTLAVGRSGQNIRLASKLTGWNIEVISESQKKGASAAKAAAHMEELAKLEGIGPKTADVLQKGGWGDIERLAGAKTDDLTGLAGIGDKTAEKIIAAAKDYMKSLKKEKKEAKKEKAETAAEESETKAQTPKNEAETETSSAEKEEDSAKS